MLALTFADGRQGEVGVLDRDLAPDTLYGRLKTGAWPDSIAAA